MRVLDVQQLPPAQITPQQTAAQSMSQYPNMHPHSFPHILPPPNHHIHPMHFSPPMPPMMPPPPPPHPDHFMHHHNPHHHPHFPQHYPIAAIPQLWPITQPPTSTHHRIILDCCVGFDHSNSVKFDFNPEKTKLVVSGKEGNDDVDNDENGGDFSLRKFRRTFALPPNLDVDAMKKTSISPNGLLMLEFPFKSMPEIAVNNSSSVVPFSRTVTSSSAVNAGSVADFKMSFSIPENVETDRIKVMCKEGDLIVEVNNEGNNEAVISSDQLRSSFYFYQRHKLPENIDIDGLKCYYAGTNMLEVRAPFKTAKSGQMMMMEIAVEKK